MTEQTLVQPQTLLHDPEWAASAMQTGPNGARFDTAAHLLSAAMLPVGVEAMYDSTVVASLPAAAFAYAGYFNGTYANMAPLKARFPNAQLVSVTPDGEKGALYIDVEPGNVTAAAVPGFIKAGGLGFYASPGASGEYSVQACIDVCTAAGIARNKYRVWSAHWIGRHICSPSTCGYPQADGTQYVSTAGWDESAVNSPSFFQLPPPDPAVLQEWKGDGRTSLAEAAALAPGQTVADVLGGTFLKYGSVGTPLRTFLNDVFAGSTLPEAALTAGVTLWLLAPPPPPSPAPAPPAPVPSPLPAWTTTLYAKLPGTRLGDQDTAGAVPWVRQVQLLLGAAGHSVPVDGDFGPQTQAGVEALQAQAGLLTTGWSDPATWEVLVGGALDAELPVLAQGAPATGLIGAAVKRVQALCEAHGLQLGIDGSFGPNTKLAVQQVQKVYYPVDAPAQDGVVGPVTWSLLAAHALP